MSDLPLPIGALVLSPPPPGHRNVGRVADRLLPALLGFAGHKVTAFVRSPVPGREPEQIARKTVEEPHRTMGARWARFVIRRRVPLVVIGLLGPLVLAIPATGMKLGLPTGENKAASDTSHNAYRLITDGFGPGANGPRTVVVDTARATEPGAVEQTLKLIEGQPDVISATLAAPRPTTPPSSAPFHGVRRATRRRRRS